MLPARRLATISGGGTTRSCTSVSRIDAMLGEVVAQQQVVDRELERDGKLETLQFFGSRLVLCFTASTIAWPLMFWMVMTLVGAAFEPMPWRSRSASARACATRRIPVQHLVADQRPAAVFIMLYIEPFLSCRSPAGRP